MRLRLSVVGLSVGPVYPMIMALGGAFYLGRSAWVSGLLTTAGIIGSIFCPPLMSVVSTAAGPGVGMAGAALLAMSCGLAMLAAGRLAAGRAGGPVGFDVPAGGESAPG